MPSHRALGTLSPDATIGQITSAGNNVAGLLASIGLSPFGHEEETLRSVCQQLKWSEMEVLNWLRKNEHEDVMSIEAGKKGAPDFGEDMARWCSYLEAGYVAEGSELLEGVLGAFSRVYKVHGTQYLWLKTIKEPFEALAEKLRSNYQFRRTKFFPLLHGLQAENELMQGTVRKVTKGLKIVREDHARILELIGLIEQKGFGKTGGDCSTLRIFSRDLQSLFGLVKKQVQIERMHLVPLATSRLQS